ncbi:glucose-1-phosphate cytidylyltransferase [uncultured Thiodictyon sp.]|uniref:glucose-1-phosphate cytidylyltransferase n=1 Tax=uncultured Thiodictyon sp. TaxID=1846217 RepID=UPI0034477929
MEIGGQPILWHILKIYSHHGINDFIIFLGYQGHLIKEHFANFLLHNSTLTIDLGASHIDILEHHTEPWRITLVDTGENAGTGGRLGRVSRLLAEEKTFCSTYGDGVGNVDIRALIRHHESHGKAAKVTAVTPPGRFRTLRLAGEQVTEFTETPYGDNGLINGGYFVLNCCTLDLIEGDDTGWEDRPIAALVQQGQLAAYRHTGFWYPMDTLRDRTYLEHLWTSGAAPWRVWC